MGAGATVLRRPSKAEERADRFVTLVNGGVFDMRQMKASQRARKRLSEHRGILLRGATGSGKTRTTYAIFYQWMYAKKRTGPALVVVPASTIEQWVAEARTAGFHDDEIVVIHGEQGTNCRHDADVYVTSVETLYTRGKRGVSALPQLDWALVAVDEIARFRNAARHSTDGTEGDELQVQRKLFEYLLGLLHRICTPTTAIVGLTATPVTTSWLDLLPLVLLLTRNVSDERLTRAQWASAKQAEKSARALTDQLFVELPGPQVPEAAVQVCHTHVAMPPAEVAVYVKQYDCMMGWYAYYLQSKQDPRMSAAVKLEIRNRWFSELTALFRVTQCPQLGDEGFVGPGSKVNSVCEMFAPGGPLHGKQVLVFGHWTVPLQRLVEELQKTGVSCATHFGGGRNNADARADFCSGSVQVLCGTYGCMGEGLNLPCGDMVMFGPPSNPSEFRQAVGRMVRPYLQAQKQEEGEWKWTVHVVTHDVNTVEHWRMYKTVSMGTETNAGPVVAAAADAKSAAVQSLSAACPARIQGQKRRRSSGTGRGEKRPRV